MSADGVIASDCERSEAKQQPAAADPIGHPVTDAVLDARLIRDLAAAATDIHAALTELHAAVHAIQSRENIGLTIDDVRTAGERLDEAMVVAARALAKARGETGNA